MKKLLLWVLPFLMGNVCHAEDITIRYNGSKAKVTQTTKDSVKVTVKDANVNIENLFQDHKLTILVKGKSNDGQLNLKTTGKAKIKLEGLELTSQEGAPICLKNKKKVEIVAAKGTKNILTVTACNDTVNHKGAVIWAKGKLQLSGKGTLNVIATGDGCRGIKTKKDITIEELTLNVTTSGDNLGEKPFGFGGFQMPEGGFQMPEGGFQGFPGGMPNFGGGFPDFGNRDDNDEDREEGDFGGFAGKHKYIASTKGIASKGKIIINSGKVTVRTSTAGAEGIEGKEGVILNGGDVDVLSTDDAINANACIEFNGAHVIARSKGNDAIDSNPKTGFFSPFGSNEQSDEPSIIIRDGIVYAWSQVGSPEEGLDCDFSPITVEGGKIFSVGGGMGEMPSVPTNATAKQPTVLLIGAKIVKNEPFTISDDKGKVLNTVTVPFSMKRSASLIGCPDFKVGSTYTVKTNGYEKTFTITENFTTVR